MKKIILIAILLLASFLRLYKLGTVPIGMYMDEMAIGVDAVNIAQTGKDMHGNSMWSAIYPSYGDYKLPVYIILAGASIKVFGPSAFSVRLPSALAGIVTVLLVYVLTKKLFEKTKQNETIGLVSAFITAILPWDMLFSRTGFEGHVGQMFVLLSMYLLFLSKKDMKWVFVSALFGAIAVYTYFSVRFVFPVLFVSYIALFHLKTLTIKKIGMFAFALVLWALLLVPMMLSPLYKPSEKFRLSARSILQNQESNILYANMLREREGNSIVSRLIYHRYLYFIKDLLTNYSTHFDMNYLFFSGDPNLRHGTGRVGIMLPVFMPFFFAGLYTFAKKYRGIGFFLFIWWMIALLPASVPLELPHALRSMNGIFTIAVTCGLGAYSLFEYIGKNKYGKLIKLVFCLLICTNVFLFLHDYYVHYPQRSATFWADGNKQAAEFVLAHKKEYEHVLISGDDKLNLWILFYGKYTAKDIQSIPSENYRKLKIDNMEFGFGSTSRAAHYTGKTLVVGLRDEITLKPAYPIYGQAGKEMYVYASHE